MKAQVTWTISPKINAFHSSQGRISSSLILDFIYSQYKDKDFSIDTQISYLHQTSHVCYWTKHQGQGLCTWTVFFLLILLESKNIYIFMMWLHSLRNQKQLHNKSNDAFKSEQQISLPLMWMHAVNPQFLSFNRSFQISSLFQDKIFNFVAIKLNLGIYGI